MMNQEMSRRALLSALAGVAAAGLAGCSGPEGAQGSAGAASGGEDLLAQIQGRGSMMFATEGTWSPWTFHNEAGNLTGYDIEVARAIASRLGVEAEFAEGEWDGLLAGLDSGRYDTMANGVSVTEEREEKYAFTEPYVDDFNQTIQLLEAGRIDATLNDEVVFYDYMAQHPDASLKIAAENDEPTHVVFPLRREDATAGLLDAMNEAIAELHEDGTLSELSNEFFGIDITEA